MKKKNITKEEFKLFVEIYLDIPNKGDDWYVQEEIFGYFKDLLKEFSAEEAQKMKCLQLMYGWIDANIEEKSYSGIKKELEKLKDDKSDLIGLSLEYLENSYSYKR